MKKLILPFLLLFLPSLCYAGSFTIKGELDSSVVKMTRISDNYPYNNYGAAALSYVGDITDANKYYTLLHFTTLADSLRAYAAANDYTYFDSATVTFTQSGTGSSGTFAFYKLKRAWGEGAATGSIAEGVSWTNADSTGGTATLWGTAGAENTTTDRSATKEVTNRAEDAEFPNVDGAPFTVPISGATIRDTLGQTQADTGGVILIPLTTTGDVYAIHSDDAITANRAKRPFITVYFTTDCTVDTLSFTTGAATAAPDKALKYNATIYQYAPTYNYGAATTTLVGFAAANREYKTMLNFLDLPDSMRAVGSRLTAAGGLVTVWDSALVTFQISSEALGSDAETLAVAFYPVIRAWGYEGAATGAVGEGVRWDSAYANGVAFPNCAGEAWGTAGCNNTTTDRSATKETIASRAVDTKIINSQSGAITVPVSGATVEDTLGITSTTLCEVNGGLVLSQIYSVGGGNENVTLKSDDDATKSNHPSIVVYYRNVYPPVATILNARSSNTLVGVRATNAGGSVRSTK